MIFFIVCLVFVPVTLALQKDLDIYKRWANVTQKALASSEAHFCLDNSWETLLVPTPVVIALIGQLTVVSGDRDFSLSANPPRGDWQHVRHPGSFRACLVQVSNDGWLAFQKAHENMDAIRLSMKSIPQKLMMLTRVIATSPPSIFHRMLKIPLEGIKAAGEKCVRLANSTSNSFMDMMLLMGEIAEATMEAKGVAEMNRTILVQQLAAADARKGMLEKITDEYRETQKQLNDKVKQYDAMYVKAMQDVPTGWDAVLQYAVVTVVDTAAAFLGKTNAGQIVGTGAILSDELSKNNLKSVFPAVLKISENIKDGIAVLFKGNPMSDSINRFKGIKGAIKFLSSTIGNKDSTEEPGLTTVLSDGLKLTEQAISLAKRSNLTDSDKAAVQHDVTQLLEEIQALKTSLDKAEGGSTGGKKPGSQQTADRDKFSVGANEKYKVEQTLLALQDYQRRADANRDKLAHWMDVLGNVMGQIAMMNMEKVDYDKLIPLMQEGIAILAQIQKLWSDLTSFFINITLRTQSLVVVLKESSQIGDVALSLTMQQLLDSAERKNLVKELGMQTITIRKEAYFIYTLSNTYVDVSSKFIMGKLAGMAELAVLEPTKRKIMIEQLIRQGKESAEQVKELMVQRREQCESVLQKEIEEETLHLEALYKYLGITAGPLLSGGAKEESPDFSVI